MPISEEKVMLLIDTNRYEVFIIIMIIIILIEISLKSDTMIFINNILN